MVSTFIVDTPGQQAYHTQFVCFKKELYFFERY